MANQGWVVYWHLQFKQRFLHLLSDVEKLAKKDPDHFIDHPLYKHFKSVKTVVFESQAPTLNIGTSQTCGFEIALQATNPIQQGTWTATGPAGETIDIPNPTQATTTATVSNYGEYTFTYTYEICDASFSSTIDVISVKPIITNTETIIYCEKEQISMLFNNLISNAIKFVPNEKQPVINIRVKEQLNSYEFEVNDNGIGIQKEYLEKIFLAELLITYFG